MSSLLMQAAQSAAAADGLAVPTPQDGMDDSQMQQARQAMMPPARAPPQQGGSSKKKGPPLRRGKWTVEEEAYANRLIQEFKAGLLPLTDGTTLRTFLSKLLNCDPMRISKKFVGSNCIGKQVFRRRTADLNRLTPEQIQQSRAELSELERRFLERVAQTNRVKSNTVVGGGAATSTATETPANPFGVPDRGNQLGMGGNSMEQATPPWLQPPNMYRPGTGASLAAANLSGAANSRAAAAGRAMLGVNQQQQHQNAYEAFKRQASGGALHSMGQSQQGHSSNSDLLAQLQRQASQSSLFGNSSSNLLAAARNGGFSSQALAQLAQNASAARLAGLGSSSNLNARGSMSDLLSGVGGLSRDQLSKLAAHGSSAGLSSASLSNMMNRQNSFDALMSLDFQSLQSIDNLANLIQTGGSVGNVPQAGMKNADFGNLGNSGDGNSAGDLSAAAQRLASSGRMESLLRSISTSNVGFGGGGNQTSNANLSNLMKTMQQQQGGASAANLLRQSGRDPSSVNLANFFRQDSSTGLSALRMQEGLNNRNTSVDDFLSLMAAGDIPHQDPSLLNVPLMDQQQGGSQSGNNNQQQQRQFSNAALANALSSRSLNGLGGNGGSNAALFGGGGDGRSQGNLNAMALAMAQAMNNGSMSGSKRSLDDLGGGSGGPMPKR
mmetsp:Transcript_6143/g.12310  ORF Transcript_6143/g.12310 Transcript_6143/m.12310 type:complete len:665 (+) Transcript_6143:186-2180(+)